MILNVSVQYAIIIIKALKHESKALLPGYKISKDYDLSNAFVDQILRKLKAAGIVKSSRGPGGGYKIVKDVTVYDLINLLQEARCRQSHPATTDIQNKVNNVLKQIDI
jgi:Rrf2 family protein